MLVSQQFIAKAWKFRDFPGKSLPFNWLRIALEKRGLNQLTPNVKLELYVGEGLIQARCQKDSKFSCVFFLIEYDWGINSSRTGPKLQHSNRNDV